MSYEINKSELSEIDEPMDEDTENHDPNEPSSQNLKNGESDIPDEGIKKEVETEFDLGPGASGGTLTKTEKRKLKYDQLRQEKEEARRAEEAYKNEQRENTYKRLMHLLSRSKFYSSFLLKKLKDAEIVPENERRGLKRKANGDEQKNSKKISPMKRPRILRGKKVNSELKELLSADTRKKIANKINLSQEDIEAELHSMSDSEDVKEATKIESQLAAAFVKPKYLNGQLRDYQKTGLEWLKVLYENGLSGILADEMGLGKTVQAIALICHLMEKKIPGPYLIIAPLSTIPNWLSELERFAPKVPVVLFYGKPNERVKQLKQIKKRYKLEGGFESQPVVLTTFEVPMREKTEIHSQKWRYIIIDEAHRIKNEQCLLSAVLRKCQSYNRLLLTGTPLQNNLAELWSLLNFLMPEVFDDLAIFESWFDAKDFTNPETTMQFLKQEQEKQVVSSLREILKPFMLRRMKTDVCLDVPPKKEVIVYAPMTDIQRELYSATLARDIAKLYRMEPEKLIIDDENGKRPRRKCTKKFDYNLSCQSFDSDMSTASSSKNSLANDNVFGNSFTELNNLSAMSISPKPKKNLNISKSEFETLQDLNQKRLEKLWGAHTNITEENSHYLTNLTFGNRATMYKQIVNHPYLVSCPLDPVGLPQIDEKIIKASGKFMVLDAMLKKLHEQGHKVLIFSTMTTLLDFIEDYLEMRPWKYRRLDGTCAIEKRKIDIEAFNTDPNIYLFLLSTRAGGIGLNLMAADTVIIFDSDWNPQADIQAMARCHRIGQTRPVTIFKFCTKGTYDEVIVDRAAAKRKLEKLVISKEFDCMKQDKDTLFALRELLESTEHEIVNTEKGVFSEEELEKLLDRSDLLGQMVKTEEKNNNS